MTALEARQKAIEKQKDRWCKISLEVRDAIQTAVSSGQTRCVTSINGSYREVCDLRALGFLVKDIIDNEVEISW